MLQVRIGKNWIGLYDPTGSDDEFGFTLGNVGGAWVGGTWDYRHDDRTGASSRTTIINLPDEAIEEIFNFVQKWRK